MTTDQEAPLDLPLGPVLLVDDSETDRYILRRMLKRGNVALEIHECQNGQRALEFLRGFEPDEQGGAIQAIFLDINMPVMNGFEFLATYEAARAELACAPSIVMLFSSSSNPEDHRRASEHPDVVGVLTKMPASPEEFRAQVALRLEQRRAT